MKRLARPSRLPAALRIGAAILASLSQTFAGPPADPPAPAADGTSGPAAPGAPAVSTPSGKAPRAPEDPPPGEGGQRRTGRIRGTVTDPAKKSLPGILVTLSSRSETDILRVTGTNERGEYRFQELPPGIYDLKVQAEGFQDARKENIEIRPPFQNIVDVRLQRPAHAGPAPDGGGAATAGAAPSEGAPEAAPVTVRGRFVDQDRKPLVEVSVVLASLQGKGIHQAYSGDDGVFEIPDVVPGRYRAIVRSPGHVPLDLRSIGIPAETGLTVSLMLVDYPLNFKAGQEAATPIEEPRPAPAPSVTGEDAPAAAAQEGEPADRPGG